ncbi:DUF2332 domain-containing protein [Arthrobacter sp. Z1-15]
MTHATAESYQRFARLEAQPTSPIYADWAASVAEDHEVLELIASLPRAKRQPNLIFAAARSAGAPLGSSANFLRWLADNWGRVEAIARSRMTQTNEAGRCAVLLPLLSRIEGPVALIEAGASAGLCLYPDRYSYRYRSAAGEYVLHPKDGPGAVELPCFLEGMPLPSRLPEVVSRAGIDLNPLDLQDRADARWLETLVWPEHDARRERLRAAAGVVAADPPRLVRGDIVDELPRLVAEAPSNAAVVVFHSAVLVYLEPERRRQFIDLVRSLDVIWISNEGEQVLPEISTLLPCSAGGRTVLAQNGIPYAFTGPHGQSCEGFQASAE